MFENEIGEENGAVRWYRPGANDVACCVREMPGYDVGPDGVYQVCGGIFSAKAAVELLNVDDSFVLRGVLVSSSRKRRMIVE